VNITKDTLRKWLRNEGSAEIRKLKDQLEAERAYLQEEIKLEFNHENIIGQSNEIKYVFYKVEQIAATDTNVLVLGETGTGKELVARAIHGLSGAQGSGPGKNELCRPAFESH
jgi:transcriptional regulator with GAF, ATPase, and Fis domain